MKHRPRDVLDQLANPKTGQEYSHSHSASAVQFHIPVYGRRVCNAPQLAQDEFGIGSAGNRESSVYKSPQDTCPAHPIPRSVPQISTPPFEFQNLTPGILRPDERHRTQGCCRHHRNRHQANLGNLGIDSLQCAFKSSCEDDSPTSAALVDSPQSQQQCFELEKCYTSHRHSAASSCYSTDVSDSHDSIGTGSFIHYYTSINSDPNEDILTRRLSKCSEDWNPSEVHPSCSNNSSPLQSHPVVEVRKDSLPPPYHSGSRKSSCATPHLKPCRKNAPTANERTIQGFGDLADKNAFLLKLCKAFLLFGIQAHRLEEYLHTTAATLGVVAEFQYIPHCLLLVLTDPITRTSQVHLVKESTSMDLGKLDDVYQVYEAVIHSDQDIALSARYLDGIIARRQRYSTFILIFLHGVAAVCAGTFAFSARPIDFGPLFVLGCTLAILQLLALRTPIGSSHILEVVTCVAIAFTARSLGSIWVAGHQQFFCFSGITQGVTALILPGHIILSATHEVQNRQIVSGSVKMIYSILYTMLMGFGILIGTVLFGFIDKNAVSETTCIMPWYWNTLGHRWRATYTQFVFVPLFAMAISVMYQAKPKHLPATIFISTCGHQAFYWSLAQFAQNLQFAGMIAAFVSGLLANIYSRITGCLAATILMPAVLIHIPNALAASGSLVSGVETANKIVSNSTFWVCGETMAGRLSVRDFSAKGPSGSTGLIVTSVYGMIVSTIGITVGLFLSALVVIPFARKRVGALAV